MRLLSVRKWLPSVQKWLLSRQSLTVTFAKKFTKKNIFGNQSGPSDVHPKTQHKTCAHAGTPTFDHRFQIEISNQFDYRFTLISTVSELFLNNQEELDPETRYTTTVVTTRVQCT